MKFIKKIGCYILLFFSIFTITSSQTYAGIEFLQLNSNFGLISEFSQSQNQLQKSVNISDTSKIFPNAWIIKVKSSEDVNSVATLLHNVKVNTITSNNLTIQTRENPSAQIFFNTEVIDSSMGLISVKLMNSSIDFWNNKNKILTDYIKSMDGVQLVQYTHKLTKRRLPNDPLINRQIHLSQISVDKLWVYSSQAINKHGDTLVVAVIDDGYDTSHPDLKQNLFINRNEIPWNGIDDDGNSYIDDYQGWNSGDQNPQVFNEVSVYDGHGTSVAGVVGATGNNGIGITGVAWTVKVLPINCWPKNMTDVELGLIRGMVYAYKMKKLYLQTNGMKGANIVAVNQSMGMDNGYPEDAPLWCQMFDSLGSVGILNAAATTNRNIKIENFGDLPTMCPSKHLIMVSASNNDNQHYYSGHSTEYVDLAAPGVGIYTTQPVEFNMNDPYIGETGTSFSSPQLAAAISLMHSLACDTFIKLQINNPDSAHRLLINWLDSSVSRNSNLKEYTRMGGSLDVWNWYQEMRNWCKAVDPTFVGLNKINKNKVQIFPNPIDNGILSIYVSESMKIDNCQFSITDLLGRNVDFWDARASDFSNSVMQRPIKLNPGTYYLNVFSGESGEKTNVMFIVN